MKYGKAKGGGKNKRTEHLLTLTMEHFLNAGRSVILQVKNFTGEVTMLLSC